MSHALVSQRRRTIAMLFAAFALLGCVGRLAPGGSPVLAELPPVSVANPGSEAAGVFAKCHIGVDDLIPFDQVAGMAKVPVVADIVHYVGLTGREPQLRETGPAWVVQLRGDIPQPMSGEIWTDPICVVTTTDSGFFATGNVRNTQTGQVFTPEPAVMVPDRVLPPLAP